MQSILPLVFSLGKTILLSYSLKVLFCIVFPLVFHLFSSNFSTRYVTGDGFGGLGVASWPLVPKFAGSNPAEAVGFLRAKKILSK